MWKYIFYNLIDKNISNMYKTKARNYRTANKRFVKILSSLCEELLVPSENEKINNQRVSLFRTTEGITIEK